ncbi:MAG: hypothetical protein BRC26_03150, partial [Nanohaloarchaea archaeon QH_8_44_6]
ILLKDIVDQTGGDKEQIKNELKKRQHVLQYMQDEGTKHYRDVGDIISRYYSDPQSVLKEIDKSLNSTENSVEIES